MSETTNTNNASASACRLADQSNASTASDSPETTSSAEPVPPTVDPKAELHDAYIAARTRAETAICEAAVKRIECVDTTNDDVLTLAKAIAELKKHDAAMLRAEAAKRLADAKTESLKATTEEKKRKNKPYDHEEFMKVLRPAVRDIYGITDEQFDSMRAESTRPRRSKPASHDAPDLEELSTDADRLADDSPETAPSGLPIGRSPDQKHHPDSPEQCDVQIHSARFPTSKSPLTKKERAPTHRRCPLAKLTLLVSRQGAVVKLHTTPTVTPAVLRGSTRQKYVVFAASGNVGKDVPG